MCGRIRLPEDYSEIQIDLFKDVWRDTPSRRWNVPPTSMLPVVSSANGQRILEPMRWGLIPSWSKDEKVGFSTFNARADSVDTKPTFRGAWKAGRRCLIITDGFYEWRRAGAADKQPFAISLGNRGPMLMAGLWEARKTPAGEWTRSCTIITTEANDLIAEIHDRMPVILDGDDWAAWLDEVSANDNQLKSKLRPYPSERMTMWPVDKRVGNVKNEGPELVERVSL